MSELGLASRREADEWIARGWVKVDGKTAQTGQKVRPNACIEILAKAKRERFKPARFAAASLGLVGGNDDRRVAGT